MPERLALPPNIARAKQTFAERRERPDVVREIWQGAETTVNGRLVGSRQFFASEGEQPTEDQVRSLAYANQRRLLQEADTDEWPTSRLTANQVALVLLEAPFATQAEITKSQGVGERDSQERAHQIATLVQFNHDLAACLGCMPPRMVADFPRQLLHRMTQTAERRGEASFPPRRFGELVAGISREVAFDRAMRQTQPEGWHTRHATAREDAMGIDVIVTNEEDVTYNIDLKTAAAFNKRLAQLLEQRTITQAEYDTALEERFVEIGKNFDGERVSVCILDADSLGRVDQFEYEAPEKVFDFVAERIEVAQAARLRNLGKNAIKG